MTDSKSSRVLIVDDMAINRIVVASLLATHGVLSDQVDNGAECIELCRKKDYDLILLDHRMPGMDGVDTLVELKEIFASKGREVPVICHTSSEGKQNVNLYKAAGFADVLVKPIEPKVLMEVIMTYLPDVIQEHVEKELEPEEQTGGDSTDLKPEDEDTRSEIEKLPLWLKIVPRIDLVAGITNCGLAEDYMDALYVFYSSVSEKADDIESFFNNKDWTNYSLCVHSLKSMARLVGAKKLADAAAVLENASREGDEELVRSNTPDFLESYREFSDILSAFEDDVNFQKNTREPGTGFPAVSPTPRLNRCILFVSNGIGIIKKGIEQNLSAAGFRVISIPDEPDRIIVHRKDADIIIYYPELSDDSHIGITMNLLGEICQDDNKELCLIGDNADLDAAMSVNGAHRVSRTYQRPVDFDTLIGDMEYFVSLNAEYRRRKTIFVVDDDTGYLHIIEHWLKGEYNVSCFGSGDAVLKALSAVKPDLLLLDYEMPGMNGCQLIKKIRTNFPNFTIPIIFLTGKNDRELVFNILEYKPDGYLLKSSQKDTILDVIRRFFAESVFRLTVKTQ